MKVYATVKENNEVHLLTWPSKKSFLNTENWCDPKFLNVACSDDLDCYEFERSSMIVYSEDQKASHKLLQKEFLKRSK